MDYSIQQPDFQQMTMNNLNIAGAVENLQGLKQQKELALAKHNQEQEKERRWAEQTADYLENPTPKSLLRLMALNPEQSENYKRLYDASSEETKNKTFERARDIYMALENNQPEVAIQSLKFDLEGAIGSGDKEAVYRIENMIKGIEKDPTFSKAAALKIMHSLPQGQEFIESMAEVENKKAQARLYSAQERKEMSLRDRAATEARFIEINEMAKLIDLGADEKSFSNDPRIAKNNIEIAKKLAQYKRIKDLPAKEKLQLEIDELKRKSGELVLEKHAKAQASLTNLDTVLSTIKRVKDNPELDNVVGPHVGADYYPDLLLKVGGSARDLLPGRDLEKKRQMAMGEIPYDPRLFEEKQDPRGRSELRADAIANIETMASNKWIEAVSMMKESDISLGTLSKEENTQLYNSIVSFSRKQSPKQFRDNMETAMRLGDKKRKLLAQKYGVEVAIPDIPNSIPEAGQEDDENFRREFDKIYKQYGDQ